MSCRNANYTMVKGDNGLRIVKPMRIGMEEVCVISANKHCRIIHSEYVYTSFI